MIKVQVLNATPDYNFRTLNPADIAKVYSKDEKIEFIHDKSSFFVGGGFQNGFVGSVHAAFSNHVDFVLNPNDIWLVIAQNISAHINANAEKFRSTIVDFEGKQTITIDHDGLVMGNDANTWHHVFPEFQKAIASLIKDSSVADRMVPEFSNSTPIELNCFRIALMDMCKNYFDYRVRTRCGIPNIYIDGTKADWEKIVDNINYLLPKFELSFWLPKLTNILNKIISTFDGDVDTRFYSSFYKYQSMSGGDTVDGWITDLFIYISDESAGIIPKKDTLYSAMGTDNFISSVSVVPFIWEYYGTNYNMNFYSGILGFDIVDGVIRTKKNFFITYRQ